MSIATRVRQSPGLPAGMAAELSGKTDDQVEAAWNAASGVIGQGRSLDDATKAVEGSGWSYDASYWFANQARIYGTQGYVKPKSYRWLARSIAAAIVVACIVWQAIRQGQISIQTVAAGIGSGAAVIFLIWIVSPRELRRHF